MGTAKQPYRERLAACMVEIAERLMSTEGLAAVQTRRVTGEADCSVGTLYNVFGGLDGLIIAVNGKTLQQLGDALTSAAGAKAGASPEDRLLALALAYFSFATTHNARWRGLFEHRMADGADVPDAYRAHQAQLFVLVEHMMVDLVPDADERHLAARALFSAVHGIVALSLESRLGPYDAQETERQIRFIVTSTVQGLAGLR